MCFFLDTTKLSDEMKAEYKSYGFNIDNANCLITSALYEKGKTYYVTGYNDGTENYTANLTVKTHTHTIKKDNEDNVKVNKDGTSGEAGGKYETCTCGYCNYIEYTENYKQIVGTTVKNAVYTGKKLEPSVRIETADGKKLNKKYYTVSYESNKKVGKGKVIIKFQNGYTGTVKKTFKINPKATTATFKKLKGGKKYYVRVRTYKEVSGKKYYSAWTKAKTTTVKK